jgi:hypothetical protein
MLLCWLTDRHGDVNGDGPAWDTGHTSADADCETQSGLREIDDATVWVEQDGENQEQEWDPEQQVPDLDVVDDKTGVDPHIEDVVESLDEYHVIEARMVMSTNITPRMAWSRIDSEGFNEVREDSAQEVLVSIFLSGGSQRLVQPLSHAQESTYLLLESRQSLRRMCIQP